MGVFFMFYYAVVNEKDIVVNIESLEESVDYFEYIPITSEDWSLCDKWYDRNGKYGTVGAFIDPPISVLAAHCTGEISYKDEDVWLDEKLDSYATQSSLNSGLATKASLNHNHSASAITETDSQKIMTAAERTKLSGIAENANNYIHPENHPASMITGLSNVATSGDYADLTNKPTIPEAYTHPASHPASMISGLASVATSGSYDDLTDKPSIPTIPESLPANGGNADTVDGYHAAAFAQAQHNHDLVYSNLDHTHSEYAASTHNHDESYANASHVHDIDEITGLETALSGKANTSHTHSNYADVDHTHSTYANSSHTHAQSDISGLSIALNAKANASHTHAQNEITNLEAALAGKASSSHNHDSSYSAISHTHSAASTTAAGFMSAADKTKLNGIAAGANAYTHPSTHAASMITGLASVATSGSYSDLTNKPSSFTPSAHSHAQSDITGLASALSGKASSSHTHSNATTSVAGFMSASDKTKLDGIATGANKTTVDSALSSTSTNPVQNKVINTALAGKANSSHTHTQSQITGLESALSGKASTSHTHTASDVGAISSDLSITSTTGAFKYSYTTSDNKNVLTEIKSLPAGVFTVYSQTGVAGNPKTTEAWRMLVHKTGNTVLWVKAFGSLGSEYSNYCADGTWQGWRCIYDVAPAPLWTGDMYMAATHTIIPTKPLSECANGWLLLWSDYNPGDSVQNVDFASTMIPKRSYNGSTWNNHQWLCTVPKHSNTDSEGFIIKTLHISDTQIVGNSLNNASPRNDVVLRAVYEW